MKKNKVKVFSLLLSYYLKKLYINFNEFIYKCKEENHEFYVQI